MLTTLEKADLKIYSLHILRGFIEILLKNKIKYPLKVRVFNCMKRIKKKI